MAALLRAGAVLALLLGVAGAAHAASAATSPAVDLLVRYETRSVDHSGVTRSESWQDRVIVRPGHVWTQRVGVRPQHDDAAHQHEHFDFDSAIQHLSRDAGGELVAEYVDPHSRTVVYVPAAEYAATGFGGNWDAAASLIPPSVVARMPVLVRAAPAGSSWREERRNGWLTRVLWDQAGQYARVVESGRVDGSVWRRAVAEAQPATPASRLPWTQLSGYQHKVYDDFMD